MAEIFYDSGLIWAFTSTKKENKGALIDVFIESGQSLDYFFLKSEESLMAVHGDFIFIRETDEMENIEIIKYKVRK